MASSAISSNVERLGAQVGFWLVCHNYIFRRSICAEQVLASWLCCVLEGQHVLALSARLSFWADVPLTCGTAWPLASCPMVLEVIAFTVSSHVACVQTPGSRPIC
jgi:hypothetical protein